MSFWMCMKEKRGNDMILYHGSYLEIAVPDLVHSRANVDFGRGFYVTPLYEQAVKWCGKFKRRGEDTTDYDLVIGRRCQ